MKVSDNPQSEEDELNILYIGIHHACEVMGGETLLYMIGHILENYGIDPVITFWIDNYQTYFVPLINPDGHYAVTQGIDNFWRKNARDTNNNGIYYEFQGGTWWTDVTEGIDLNRNYDWFWELGGSGDRRSYYYRGSAPFSENETQAIQSLGLAHHFVTGISFHSYGEVVIYPWSYYGQPAPDQDVYNTFASALASHFIKDSGGGYSTSIYSAQSGECRNWFYGVTGGMFFCIELMPFPLFTPPGYQLAERTQRYYNGAIYLYERIQGPGITGHVTDAVTGNPLEARVEIGGRISSQVYPRYSESLYGRYSRLLNPGSYTVIAGARNYQTQRIYNVVVSDTLTVLNIQLTPITVAGTGEEVSLVESPKISLNCSPNPFNNELTISYSLLEATQVSLKIFNSLGHMVYSEETGMQSMGEHSLKWNAQGQGSGIYFAQLTVDGDQSIAQKLLLLK
jgi:hypothetical protein